MRIKLKGVCVDINKPRSKEALTTLLKVCEVEYITAKQPKKAFIKMFINIIEKKLKKEYCPINKINTYEEKAKFA
tara:strand:- start:3597 stop:3821 length:225 start_codon:yes stop_codon:yes gene_type:complete